MLEYFYKNASDDHIVAAGSLLGDETTRVIYWVFDLILVTLSLSVTVRLTDGN
ncbi:MAG: hypothetical protein ACLTSL_17875 [Odoribacter splanchnicus]